MCLIFVLNNIFTEFNFTKHLVVFKFEPKLNFIKRLTVFWTILRGSLLMRTSVIIPRDRNRTYLFLCSLILDLRSLLTKSCPLTTLILMEYLRIRCLNFMFFSFKTIWQIYFSRITTRIKTYFKQIVVKKDKQIKLDVPKITPT